MTKKICAALALAGTIAGCAEYPANVEAAYIPSIVYKGATCTELAAESRRLIHYVDDLTRRQRRSANIDTALVTTGTFYFWPALGGLPLTRDQSAQLAVARGHYDALTTAAQKLGCQGAAPARYQTGTNWKRGYGSFPPL
ncbi:hypothetical protein N6L24_03235 [Cognatishimia sp. SS12]|uniref:hypothetical protein n=1 Tax=Cognatishimia sp. SS12 TaxID=2979465 RepID=UPI00232B526F|nr:hypothetical protein [Cognatishimia sp. SS12]MDC0737279.1 hypothetical protein [Cognatishimia sp. SS12]